MPLPIYLQVLLKTNYLYYRKAKAAKKGPSLEMQRRINALNSQYAIRPHIPQAALFDPTKGAMEVQLRNKKLNQRQENIDVAMNELIKYLYSGTGESKAMLLKHELDWLGDYFVSKSPPGTRWIPGPLKKVEKAMSKTDVDYGFLFGQNKDLVRSTLGCATNEDLELVSTIVKQTCIPEYGMFLIKQDQQKSVRDSGLIKSGYSGWNFAIQFKDHPDFPAEVQANTFNMLYGKAGKKSFMEQFDVKEEAYRALQTKMKFPGGMGHALYDISDSGRCGSTPAEGKWCEDLALDYYDACRGQFRMTTLQRLNAQLMETGPRLGTPKAVEYWNHAVHAAAWPQPIPLATLGGSGQPGASNSSAHP